MPSSERSSIAELAAAYPGDGERLDQMTQHPPLYYLLAGKLIALAGAVNWHWDQALLLVRLIGAPVGAAVVWLAWSTVSTLTRSRRTGIVAAAVVFVVPGFAQMVGVANNDTLAILLGAVMAWLSVKVLTGDRRPGVLVALGIAFGLAGLAKGTMIAYGPLIALAILFGRNHPPTWPRRLWQTAWPLLISLAFGQWWWLRNLALFGTLQPYGYLLSDSSWAPGTGPSLLAFVDEFWRVMSGTFWGWFGRVNAPLPRILVEFLMVTCIVLVVVGMFRFRRRIPQALLLATPIAVSAVLMLRVSWGAYVETTEFRGMHGRYFYAVLIPIIALSALALRNLVRERDARTVFGAGVVVVSAFMALFGLGVSYVYFYADDLWSQWRRGVGAWINVMSAVPGALNLVVAGAAVLLLVTGSALAVREIVRRSAGTPHKAHDMPAESARPVDAVVA